MSSSLVFLSNNNLPLTTTVIIADSLDKRHTDVLALTHKYETELKNFGAVPFKTEQVARGCGAEPQQREFAYLNEQQATLLISMMRNCPKVIAFKIALVKAFYEMRQALAQHSHTYSPDEIAHIKEKALKQGYAIACAKFKEQEPERQLKDDEIAISKETAKQIFKILDFSAKHKREMMKVATEMREQASVLMLAAEGYEFTKSIVQQEMFNKL